ncbi:hypothetical protein YC2023_017978 [Brassica napus]
MTRLILGLFVSLDLTRLLLSSSIVHFSHTQHRFINQAVRLLIVRQRPSEVVEQREEIELGDAEKEEDATVGLELALMVTGL